MPNFVICGKASCGGFVHAIEISRFICEHLPNVSVNRIEKSDDDWPIFLAQTNEAFGWHHRTSPIIWKEVGMRGGKPYLIGGLSEFWEYIDDYYGMFTYLDRETVEKMRIHNFKMFEEERLRAKNAESNAYTVGIYHFTTTLPHLLIYELFSIPNLTGDKKLAIKIFETEALRDPSVKKDILEFIEELSENLKANLLFSITVEEDVTDFVASLDLLLITKDYSRLPDEDESEWLQRCSIDLYELAFEMNEVGKRQLRTIFCHLGPVCFNAHAMINYCSSTRIRNIVAVTAHEGFNRLNMVCENTGYDMGQLSAPPVWGFVGLQQFVDVYGIFVQRDVVRPYLRAVKDIKGSTLPTYRIHTEVAVMSCCANYELVEREVANRAEKYRELKVNPVLPIIRATVSLLTLWYSTNKQADEIISLGVCSNGSFDIPNGLVFSQPVMLNDEKLWVPYKDLPILPKSRQILNEAVVNTLEILRRVKNCFQ